MTKIRFQFLTENIQLINFLNGFSNVSKALETIISDFQSEKLIYKEDSDLTKRTEKAKVETLEIKLKILQWEYEFMKTFEKSPKQKHKNLFKTRAFNDSESEEILAYFHIETVNKFTDVYSIQCSKCLFNCKVNESEKLNVASQHILKEHNGLIQP